MNLSEFLAARNPGMNFVNEAINTRDLKRAITLIQRWLLKYRVYVDEVPINYDLSASGLEPGSKLGISCWTDNYNGAIMTWDLTNWKNATTSIDGVLFIDDINAYEAAMIKGETYKGTVYAQAKGANIVQMCKLIMQVLSGKIKMNVDDIYDFLKGAQIYEGQDNEDIQITEALSAEALRLHRVYQNLYMKRRNWVKKGRDTTELDKQLAAAKEAYNTAKTNVVADVVVTPQPDKTVEKGEDRLEEEVRALPEERFEDMEDYIKSVISGFDRLALLCGAPGVGKTYRVMKLVNSVREKDKLGEGGYKLMKGKCTAASLFLNLFMYREKGQLMVFDDCDSIFADEDAINIIKAAYDSSDHRYVSWNTSRRIVMPDDVVEICSQQGMDIEYSASGKPLLPTQFEYEGCGIIITNYRAGMIDTAIRNRAVICDLDFTPQEVLDLVTGIAPHIMPDLLSQEAKDKALAFLQRLVDEGAPVEISIRSFTTVAKRYMSNAPERAIERRIREQMRNQFATGGRKY